MSSGVDYDAEKKKRLQALEDKKKRLEEMRKRSKDRAEDAAEEISQAQSADASVDNLVNSILSVNISNAPSTPPESVIETNTPNDLAPVSREDVVNQRKLSLSTVRKSGIHIMPALPESYDKMCQTDESGFTNIDPDTAFDSPDVATHKPTFRRSVHGTHMARPSSTPLALQFDSANNPVTNTPASRLPRKLDPEAKSEIIQSEPYKKFIDSSSRIIERALGQSLAYDIIKDYSQDNKNQTQSLDSKTFSLLNTYEDEFIRHRPVMDIQPNAHYEELFLAAYGAKGQAFQNRGVWQLNTGSEDDPAGVVCVWSLALPARPEFKFTSSSPVLTSHFHPAEKNIIVGGCYSGQILLWDMRAKALPVQRSNLAGKGHKHPVYSLAMLGSGSVYELVTASTDGTLCHWDLARLSEPTNATPIMSNTNPSGTAQSSSDWTTPVNVTSMAFGHGDTSRDVVLGSECGRLFRTSVPIRPREAVSQVNGHLGLVTAMNIHPNSSKLFKNLLLTSSLDWSVKLWNLNLSTEPLLEFQTPTYDYVCDVQWSPTHPALFSTITSGGILSLWNLCKSTVEPLDSMTITNEPTVSDSLKTAITTPSAALNRAVWSLDGRRIMAGDAKGTVHMVSIAETTAKAKVGDESRFELAILHRKDSQLQGQSADSIPAPRS